MVVASSSGMFQSIARLRSRTGTAPSTLTEPSGSMRTPGDRDLVLVGDVADDLFDDVLDRHQALQLAILVDHQRERRLAVAERLELLVERRGVGHEPGRPRQRLDVDLGEHRRRRRAARAADPSTCRTPTMFSGLPRHSGTG